MSGDAQQVAKPPLPGTEERGARRRTHVAEAAQAEREQQATWAALRRAEDERLAEGLRLHLAAPPPSRLTRAWRWVKHLTGYRLVHRDDIHGEHNW